MKLQCYDPCPANAPSSLALMPCFYCPGALEPTSEVIMFTATQRIVTRDGEVIDTAPHNLGDLPGIVIRLASGRLVTLTGNPDAAGPAILATSDDGGLTWLNQQTIDNTNLRVNWRLFEHDGKLYANATENPGWVSADNGATWTSFATPSGTINPLLQPWPGGILHTHFGTYSFSADDGTTWGPLPGTAPADIAGGDIGIVRQLESGRWIAISTQAVYGPFAAGNNIAYSDDDGATWTELHIPEQFSQQGVHQMSYVPAFDKLVVCRSNCGLLVGSPDGGEWEFVNVTKPGFTYYMPSGYFGILREGIIMACDNFSGGWIKVESLDPVIATRLWPTEMGHAVVTAPL